MFAKMVASPFDHFELSPLNELHRGKICELNNSYTLCDLMIFGIHVY